MLQVFKFQLAARDKTVVFKIFEMPEYLRREEDEKYWVFKASNGMRISSDFRPKLMNDHISVRGVGKLHDLEEVSITLSSNRECDNYIKRALEALSEWTGGTPVEAEKHIYTLNSN